MEVDNYRSIDIQITLAEGETLKYTGGNMADVYNANWKKIREEALDLEGLNLSAGSHSLLFDCEFSRGEEVEAALELRLVSEVEKIEW